jgi:integrase
MTSEQVMKAMEEDMNLYLASQQLANTTLSEENQKMVNDMIEQGLSPKNIRDTYVNVNSAMKQAVKLRMIAYNPCEGVTLPKRKKYKSNVYDTEMISKLLDLARGTDIYIPILLCVSAGLRRGEMLALGWDNVDFEKGIISIQRNLVRGEDGYIIKAPKSESGIRDIHLGREVMEELRKAKVPGGQFCFCISLTHVIVDFVFTIQAKNT